MAVDGSAAHSHEKTTLGCLARIQLDIGNLHSGIAYRTQCLKS